MTKAQRLQLKEIKAQSDAARARGDWRTYLALQADWSHVFRQSMQATTKG